ncbi:hypothetical protein RclHR1_01480003 [Rhizophagus clarus]|uniref:Sel1 repeat family protein n=1 Tax=Rhizophagus clarus TaxID=94130 RepID=A0A2Z6R693_9GLOM|nr:hypothetical protein RclHR1_01480003 [Rhizophagus clarus]GET00892.1 Sel1 repeat family protein [Rhizophagus clarus]
MTYKSSTTNISKNGEILLKEFVRDFYHKILDINDLRTFEITLCDWIKNIDKNQTILKLLWNHKDYKLYFASVIGFFYQHGISCAINRNKALELYLLAVNNEKSLNQDYKNSQFLKGNDDEFHDILRNNNIIIGKYLLSLFYYKDIILNDRLKYFESARKGEPIAQYNLGYCYQYGKGVAINYDEAFKWYSKSANNGCAEGQNNLGNFYYYGRGISIDYKKAFELYLKSAKNGYNLGQCNLGYCYQYGKGVAINYDEAFKWYSKSANNGCALAQNNLAHCYENGIGTKKDFNKAFELYSKAADGKCVLGQYNLAVYYENGIGTNKNYNIAFKWYFKSANEGYGYGQYKLGNCYQYGIGTYKNIKEANVWYKKASDNGIKS